jgi:hypothetical protein
MTADTDSDFLDEVIQERGSRNPAFPAMVDEAYGRRLLLRQLAEAREAESHRGRRPDGHV